MEREVESEAAIYIVTFREEGVDWNIMTITKKITYAVTFREEGVDWNVYDCVAAAEQFVVTFREEGVDWN